MPQTSNTALTLNARQARALSILAPGTLLHAGFDGPAQHPFFITAEDDRARTGTWGISVRPCGGAILHRTEGDDTFLAWGDVLEREAIAARQAIQNAWAEAGTAFAASLGA